jgi:cysteine desulfurase
MENNTMRYFDYAATTPCDPRVLKKMEPYFNLDFGNPSSIHQFAVDNARVEISQILGCSPEEIYFTSGGTESDNIAILGTARANQTKGKHVITTTIEHHAVLNPCEQLESEGFEITYINVDKDGIINPDEVKKAIRSDTILVSIMYANNEIGTIQPIWKIGRYCKNKGIPFHTDACQAAGVLEMNVDKLIVDLMTLNGGKIYGPKGIGLLYVRKHTNIWPIMFGGEQEKRLRPGTENVPGIVGLAETLKLAQKDKEKENKRLTQLRDMLIKGIIKKIPKVKLNGHPEKRLPNNINVSILDIEGEAMLLRLDMLGIAASSGSACTSGSLDPSHVILALGHAFEVAHGSIRFTLGKYTKKEDIEYVLKVLPKVVEDLRKISPVRL